MSPPPPLTVPVAKGAVCYCLDEISKGPSARIRIEALRDAVAALAPTYAGLAEVFDEYLVSHVIANLGARQKILEHLKLHWFDDGPASFFPGTPVAKIYAEGLLKTLELVLSNVEQKVTINSWWLLDQPDFAMLNVVDLSHGVAEGCVTLLVLTPRPDDEGDPIPPWILGDTAEAFVTSLQDGAVTTVRVSDLQ